MKRFAVPGLAAIAMAGAFSLTTSPVKAQSRAKATNVPTISHEAVPNFFKNPPGIYTGENMFNTPHSIATDFQGNVYVGDRGNARVTVLDNELNLKANYDQTGNPWAVCVSGGPGPKNPGKQYLYVSNSWPDSALAAQAEYTGEVYKMELDGTIIGKFGKGGKAVGEFSTIHQMDCRDPDTIVTAEINNWRSQKILLKPTAAPSKTSAN